MPSAVHLPPSKGRPFMVRQAHHERTPGLSINAIRCLFTLTLTLSLKGEGMLPQWSGVDLAALGAVLAGGVVPEGVAAALALQPRGVRCRS